MTRPSPQRPASRIRPRSSAIVTGASRQSAPLAADLGRLGEAEGDIVDLALHRGADQVGRDAALAAIAERHAAAPLGEQLGGAAAAAQIDPHPRPLDEQVAAAEAGELGVAGIEGCGERTIVAWTIAALDDDRHVARRARAVGGGGDVDPLVAAGGGELDGAARAPAPAMVSVPAKGPAAVRTSRPRKSIPAKVSRRTSIVIGPRPERMTTSAVNGP